MTSDREQLNILIVDDHPMLRRGVKQLLELEAGLDAIGEASSGQEALEIAERLEPDLILLDLNMTEIEGGRQQQYGAALV